MNKNSLKAEELFEFLRICIYEYDRQLYDYRMIYHPTDFPDGECLADDKTAKLILNYIENYIIKISDLIKAITKIFEKDKKSILTQKSEINNSIIDMSISIASINFRCDWLLNDNKTPDKNRIKEIQTSFIECVKDLNNAIVKHGNNEIYTFKEAYNFAAKNTPDLFCLIG